MKLYKNLVKKEREEIFKLFLENKKLSFNNIQRGVNIKSNSLAYYLDTMIKEKLIIKKRDFYYLTNDSESYLPLLSNFTNQLFVLPIVLVAVINNGRILLMKRSKRPYKNYWGLIGGKMLLHENFKETSLRLLKEKADLKADLISLKSISQEKVKDKNLVKYNFILFLTKTTIKYEMQERDDLKLFDLKKLNNKIIPSDLWLIKNKLNTKIKFDNIIMKEKNEKLISFIVE